MVQRKLWDLKKHTHRREMDMSDKTVKIQFSLYSNILKISQNTKREN